MGDWASLPRNLLDSILDELVPSVVDSILENYCMTFSAVCTEWRSVACEKLDQLRTNHKRHCSQHQNVPLLASPTTKDGENSCSLYDITRKTLGLTIPLDTKCWGSSHGWLILDTDYLKVTLLNPFSGKVIYLPQLSPSRPLVISSPYGSRTSTSRKFLRGALSIDPDMNRNEYVFMLIYGSYRSQKLAFIRSGDKHWSYIDIDEHVRDYSDFTHTGLSVSLIDIIYNNGVFYVIDRRGMLLSCDVSSSTLKVRRVTPPDTLHIGGRRPTCMLIHTTYIVESPQGDLLRVVKILSHTGGNRTTMTTGFVIYKLVCSQGIPTWTEVKSLGDVALFLGDSHSISVTASDFVGCQSNSIYFCGHDVEFSTIPRINFDGVFNLSDGSMTPLHLHLKRMELQSERLNQPMFWILPPSCEARLHDDNNASDFSSVLSDFSDFKF